jgi:hypothetical protein
LHTENVGNAMRAQLPYRQGARAIGYVKKLRPGIAGPDVERHTAFANGYQSASNLIAIILTCEVLMDERSLAPALSFMYK